MKRRVGCFPPVARADARVLILGSMPGAVSLGAQQYYAHPYNQFWVIMGSLCGAGPQLPYRQRLEQLQRSGIALWDVFESCARPGSLDSSIDHSTAIVNDLPALLQRCPRITRICCNGATAYSAFKRRVAPQLAHSLPGLHIDRLPSTSPANASWSPARKLAAWRAALAELDGSSKLLAIRDAAAESTTAEPARYRVNVPTHRPSKPPA